MAASRRLTLRFLERARSQLTAIGDHVARDDPAAALRVLATIRRAAERLTVFPQMGRAGSTPTTREWVVAGLPYIIVYRWREEDGEILVVAVFHAAQDRSRQS